MKFYKRKTTFFEKILLTAGFFMGFIGFFIINTVFKSSGNIMSYEMIISIFLWIILLFLIIIAATSENQKEEAMVISYELHQETKMVKEFMKEQLKEVKKLREDLNKK